jgi:Holliday junction resolvasome RuvABC endonuclease subunit
MVICGIDYSMTSPALVVHEGKKWTASSCSYHFFAKTKKQVGNLAPNFYGQEYPKYTHPMERYTALSSWVSDIIDNFSVDLVYLEDYAFAAKGKVFHIAENTAILKYMLWEKGIPCVAYKPNEVKNFATGYGNASKEAMCDKFAEDTGLSLDDILSVGGKASWNPKSDIADAYFIAKCGFFREFENADQT